MKAMGQKYDDLTGFISGLAGTTLAINLAGITWQSAWESFGQILWLGFIALFSGGMGVLGKHLITKYLNRKKK